MLGHTQKLGNAKILSSHVCHVFIRFLPQKTRRVKIFQLSYWKQQRNLRSPIYKHFSMQR